MPNLLSRRDDTTADVRHLYSKERKKNALLFIGHSGRGESGETRQHRSQRADHNYYTIYLIARIN
jgi:hypothetical protein